MRVVEIFGSIDGEGKRTGQLTTFIRLAGCNLRCCYCDTAYSFDMNNATEMSIPEIVKECQEIGFHNITLTGGEPLIHKDVNALIFDLCSRGYQVNIETNGSVDLRELCSMRNKYRLDFFFTVDYKAPHSGMCSKMNEYSFSTLDTRKDIVKCVVSCISDMDMSLKYLDAFKKNFNIWFSPVFGKIEPKTIVEYVMYHNRQDITVQVQLHKIIWDPDKRGV